MITVEDVAAFARAAHAGQTDKLGRDYCEEHLAPIAAKLADVGPEAEIAAWLHDVLEDTSVTVDQLRELGVPETVVAAVVSVSKREGEPYDALIARAAADPLGRLVKLAADNERNLESNDERARRDPDLARRLRTKYEHARTQLLATGQHGLD
ncbi:HD domain-containing protein [Yimella lutea]